MNAETDESMRSEEAGGVETEAAEVEAAGGTEQNGNGPEDRSVADAEGDGAAELRAALSRAEERLTQLERERSLLSQGVAEEDLDYYVFKIGKLVTGEKDFDTAAKEFLKQRGAARRVSAPHSTGASLAGRASAPRSTNDTMNRILRGI
jgi:hypothetical protein